MANLVEFPNLKLEYLRSCEKYNLIAAFGYRTVVLLDKNLDLICRYLDANKSEKFLCAAFFENIKEIDTQNDSETPTHDSSLYGNHNSHTSINTKICQNFCSENPFFLFLAGESGVIKVIDLKDAKLVTILQGHTGAICDIKIVGKYVISGGEDSTIRIWDLDTLKCVNVCGGLAGHKDRVLSLDVLPDLSLIVSSGIDCVINQWQIPNIKKDKKSCKNSNINGNFNERHYSDVQCVSSDQFTNENNLITKSEFDDDLSKIKYDEDLSKIKYDDDFSKIKYDNDFLKIDYKYNKKHIEQSESDKLKSCSIDKDFHTVNEISSTHFIHKPFKSFNNVHKCPINKVKYCGDLIISLSTNLISLIYNKREDQSFKKDYNLDDDDPIYIGFMECYGNCKSFEIYGHILIGVSTNADIYLFNLRNIITEKSPYLVSTNIGLAEDIALIDGTLFISSGSAIHKFEMDFECFN